MDLKTLSAMLDHILAATLDIYTHVTRDMQAEAAGVNRHTVAKWYEMIRGMLG